MADRSADFDYPELVPAGALFIAADEPLLVFPSVVAAERSLEAIDVADGVYSAIYGPKGEPYRVGTAGNHVVIEPTGEADRPDELRHLLLGYLQATGRIADAPSGLDDIVQMIWASEAEFWNDHDPYGDRLGTAIPRWGCLVALTVLAALYLMLR